MTNLNSMRIPTGRDVQRVLRQLPVRNWGRPSPVGDVRLWAGVGIGLGLGGVIVALTQRSSGPETRERLRARFNDLRDRASTHSVSCVEESVVVEVPARVAYNQWTQFEEFPRFMQGVASVEQVDDKRLHWKAEIGGRAVEWDSEIVEQIPDHRIAWRNLGEQAGGGVVTFHRLDDKTCRVMVQMDYEPQGAIEQMGDTLGVVRRRIRGDLDRFRDFIEGLGEATGEFREVIG